MSSYKKPLISTHSVVQLGSVEHHVRRFGLVPVEHEQGLHLAAALARADGVTTGAGRAAVLGSDTAAPGPRPTSGKRVAIQAKVGKAKAATVGHVFLEEGGIA